MNKQNLDTDASPDAPLLCVVLGRAATLFGSITLEGGTVEQGGFDTTRVVRVNQMPILDIHLPDSSDAPGGAGEPSVAPLAPALENGVFAATGRQNQSLPPTAAGLG